MVYGYLEEKEYESLDGDNVGGNYIILPSGLENNKKQGKNKNEGERFSNSECIVPQHSNNTQTAVAPNPAKSKTLNRIFSRKSKASKSEERFEYKDNPRYTSNSPQPTCQPNSNHRYDFDCQFPSPVGPQGFKNKNKEYEINDINEPNNNVKYEDIDVLQSNMSLPLSPCTRIPFYITTGKMFEQVPAPVPFEPQEDYMDMEGAYKEITDLKIQKYDAWPEVIPPMRKTITFKVVRSHDLSILRKEYRNIVPEAPKRSDSLGRKGEQPSSGHSKIKGSKSSGYDIPKFNITEDQLKIKKKETNPTIISESFDNPPKEKSPKKSEKILNRENERPNSIRKSNSPSNVFYHLHEIIPPFVQKQKSMGEKSPNENTYLSTCPINQRKPINPPNENNSHGSIPPIVHKAKPIPEKTQHTNYRTAQDVVPQHKPTTETHPNESNVSRPAPPTPTKPKPKTRRAPSEHQVGRDKVEQEPEDIREPTRFKNNISERSNSMPRKQPPPIKPKQKISNEDDKVMNDIQVEKKDIKNIKQDLEKHLKQMNILESIATKSHFKQLNLYEDVPSKVVGVMKPTSPIDSSNNYLEL